MMRKTFISEPIQPVLSTMDTATLVTGEPGMPGRFIWRGEEHAVAEVLERWKETSQCKSGANEQYVRKHWFRIRTTGDINMTIYFERQPASKRERLARWWIFSMMVEED